MSASDDRVERPSVSIPGEMIDRIEARLDYGDSKAEWIRQACRLRLAYEQKREAGLSEDEAVELIYQEQAAGDDDGDGDRIGSREQSKDQHGRTPENGDEENH